MDLDNPDSTMKHANKEEDDDIETTTNNTRRRPLRTPNAGVAATTSGGKSRQS